MSSQPVVFHLHGQDPGTKGVIIPVLPGTPLKKVQQDVANKLAIAVPSGIYFVESTDPSTLATDLKRIETTENLLANRAIGIIIDGKTPRSVPGPTGGLPFVGSYSELYPDFMGNYQRLLDKYGHVVHVGYMGKNVYLTDDPEVVSVVLSEGDLFSKEVSEDHPLYPLKLALPEGLFTSNSASPAWGISHKMFMAAMSAKAMRHYVKIMDHSAKQLSNNILSEFADKGQSFDVFSWTLRTAAQTIGEVTFNQDFGLMNSPTSKVEGLGSLIQTINQNLHLSQELFRKGKWYRALPNPEYYEQQRLTKIQWGVIQEEVEKNRKTQRPDIPYLQAATEAESLLDFMLRATDDDGSKLDLELILQNAATFLGAGQVTTASALGWLLYTLSHYPEYDEKLYRSLLEAGLNKDSDLSADKINSLEYLDWFIKETQRLYNPAFQPTRQAHKEVVLPGGFIVPAGAQVTVAIHSVHVNKEHWKDPYTFNPDRWGTEEVKRRHKNAYIPFATGARGCIGFNFALQEIKLVLTRLVLNYRVEDVTEGAVVYDPGFSLYRPENFKAKVHRRPEPSAEAPKPKVETKAEIPRPTPLALPKSGTKKFPKLFILYGSNNGTSQGFASELSVRAQSLGFSDIVQTSLSNSVLMSRETLPSDSDEAIFLIVACSYNGYAPDNALSFDEVLDAAISEQNKFRFSTVKYSIFGTGNKQWGPTYQAFPNKIDASLSALGATSIFPKGSGDVSADQEGDFAEWSTGLWASISAGIGLNTVGDRGGSTLSDPVSIGTSAISFEFVRKPAGLQNVAQKLAPLEGMGLGFVESNQELVDEDSPKPRAMRLIYIKLPEGHNYEPGDHLEIFPENDPISVDQLIASLGLVEGAAFQVNDVDTNVVNSKSLAALLKGRGPITVKEALTLYGDLSGPVPRSSLQIISALLPEKEEYLKIREEFSRLGSVNADKEDLSSFAAKNRNFVALFHNYPLLSRALEWPQLLIALNSTQTRRYSIASSPLVHKGVAAVCVGVVREPDSGGSGADWEGLCSGFLRRSGKGSPVWVKTRKCQDSFHLPEDPKVPVIMVAAGTGIAPFLGFLEHRQALGYKDQEHGGVSQTRVYYGVSHHDMSALRSLVQSYVDDGTSEGRAVYSKDLGPRRYVQDLITQDGLEVWSWIESGARIYVCGSAGRVGAGVREAVNRVAKQVGAIPEAGAFVSGMIRAGKYAEDIFG